MMTRTIIIITMVIAFVSYFATISIAQADSVEYRTFDGTANNPINPSYGNAGQPLLRMSGVAYDDGTSTPSGSTRSSPRIISNVVVAQDGSIPSSSMTSDMVWQWGQFLDHDLDLVPTATPIEIFDIEVPTGDPFFDPNSEGDKVISFSRSLHNNENPRQQINTITAFIDASQVYGSDSYRAAALRTFSDGKLKTSDGDMLPFNIGGLPNGGGPSPTLFLAGDVRVNEQIGLTAIHTLFVREHNRLADEIAVSHPEMSDEEIYQTARRIVGAQIQVITYNEFLPMILGYNTIPEYQGYHPEVNPGISNEFAAASFRFGHSMLSPNLLRITNSGGMIFVPLRNSFFNPALVGQDDGIDSILRGLAEQRAQEIDNMIVDDVRNFLFGPPGSGGFDLASLNIQRGRDHGLPDYNSVREAYGLNPVTSFTEISSDPEVQSKLESAYGDVNNIDLWVGGLAEDNAPGALVGKTVKAVLSDQFTRVRDGDRFWYENDPFFTQNNDLMYEIKTTTLSDIIKRNTSMDEEFTGNAFRCCNLQSQVVGGKIIPVESTALLLAGLQSTTWIIPVVLSIVGVGVFAVSRKSENS